MELRRRIVVPKKNFYEHYYDFNPSSSSFEIVIVVLSSEYNYHKRNAGTAEIALSSHFASHLYVTCDLLKIFLLEFK